MAREHSRKVVSISLFKQRGSLTKDSNLPVTDGVCKQHTVHNGSFPALRALQHTRARIPKFLALLKTELQAQAIKVHLSQKKCTTRTPLHSGTTLDTQATVSDYNNPSAHSRFRSMFGDFDERASLTEERSEVTLCAFAVWLRNVRIQTILPQKLVRKGGPKEVAQCNGELVRPPKATETLETASSRLRGKPWCVFCAGRSGNNPV